jgi:hypothetical protein
MSSDCGCDRKSSPINSDWNGGRLQGAGHPANIFTGYVNNDARASEQIDINPVPVVPVHFQGWPGIQVQLLNGWELTNYGKIAVPYNNYLQKAGGGTGTYPKAPKPLPGQGLQPQGNSPPSQVQLNNSMSLNANQQGTGATGNLAPGVQSALTARRYYG